MKKHYYFISSRITFHFLVFDTSTKEMDYSDSFELIQEHEKNKDFFLSVEAKLKKLLTQSFLKIREGAQIEDLAIISIDRLN